MDPVEKVADVYRAIFSVPGIRHIGPDQPAELRIIEIRRGLDILLEHLPPEERV